MKSKFSLRIYLLIVCLLSWPFQIAYMFLGETFRPILLVSMIMVTVGTFICGKYIFNDGFKEVGWTFGKPKHYLMAFSLPLFLWALPVVIEMMTGLQLPTKNISLFEIFSLFISSFLITLLPSFGEEFGWRGYLLPRLLKRYSPRKALLLHGLITWFWHLPFILVLGKDMGGNLLISILSVLLISLIPTIMHAVVFAYFWSSSNSIAVVTVYHSAFDEVRDTMDSSVGFGPLVEIWQMATLTILGLVLLWKNQWIKHKEISKGL